MSSSEQEHTQKVVQHLHVQARFCERAHKSRAGVLRAAEREHANA